MPCLVLRRTHKDKLQITSTNRIARSADKKTETRDPVQCSEFVDIRRSLVYIDTIVFFISRSLHTHRTAFAGSSMALTRKGKIWLIVLAVPLLLLVGGVIAVKAYFTGDRLKAIIIPKIEEETKRSVSINTIDLSVFPTLAIEVGGLAISNPDGKGFSKRPFLALERLVLDVRLLSLLKGSLEITTVVLERPDILLEINTAGIANYADNAPPPAMGSPALMDTGRVAVGTAADAGGAFLLSNLQIVDGRVEYVDRKENSAMRIEGLNQKIRMEYLPVVQEMRIESESSVQQFSYGSVSTPLVSGLHLASRLDLLYEGEEDRLLIQEGELTVQDMALAVKGTIGTVSGDPNLDIALESDRINIAELLSIAPKEYMKKAEGVKGEGIARVRISITGVVSASTTPTVSGAISATDARIQYARLPKPITNVNLVADFTRSAARQEFRLTKCTATLGNNPLSVTLMVVNFDAPALTMAINASLRLDEMKDYYPLETGTQLSGTMKANVNIAGRVANPAAMKAAGTMEFQSVTIKSASSRNPVQNLNGTVTFNNQIVETKRLVMTLGRSDLAVGFRLKNYLTMMSDDPKAPKPTANLTLASNHLYTADIMSDDASVQGGSGTSVPTSTPSVPKEGKSPQAPPPAQRGVPLPNVDMEIAATIGTLTMEKLELSNVKSMMRIADGVITMRDFTCATFGGSVATRGTVNMRQPDRPVFDLALDLNGLDAHALLPKFTSFGSRMFGTLTMNTTLKGALDDTLGLIPRALEGQGKVQVANGSLTGVKTNAAIATLLNLPDLEEISFKDWAQAFTISDGRMFIKDLKISALGADYVVQGSQGLDGTLDLTMSMLLSEKTSTKVTVPGFAGEAVKLFKDESTGRVRLNLVVGGTTENPKVALDTREAQQRAQDLVKQKVADEAKKLEDQAKKKGEELLKGLFKKKK